MKIETVKIVDKDHPYGYKIINKSDMKEKDVVFSETAKKTTKKKGGK